MNAARAGALPAHLHVVLTLADLLTALESSRVPVGAEQYRSVARRLAQALAEAPQDETLRALLDARPAAAELYENIHYAHAGLCRAPLDAALGAETKAAEAIRRAAARVPRA
jgi:hypothetical protein